jgi:hypothetical protein
MVYVRCQDVDDSNLELTRQEWCYLEAWKLENHPFVRLDKNGLQYRAIRDVWWVILTPYEVPIPSGAIWELVMGGDEGVKQSRGISNLVTLKLVRNLSVFNG